MSEKRPRPESALAADPYKEFELLTQQKGWSPEIEERLRILAELHETDLYMIYLNYTESGLVDELSEYESKLYNWLKDKFEKDAE